MIDRIAGVRALFAGTNKGPQGQGKETEQGPVSDLLPELQLEMSDEQLLELAKDWKGAWDKIAPALEAKQLQVEQYWLGLQGNAVELGDNATRKPQADNCIYESLETFLPKATQKSPEPLVSGDGTEIGNQIADVTAKMLSHVADLPHVRLKMTLRDAARHNQLYFLGAVKTGWSETDTDVTADVIRPQRLILDPDANIKNAIYDGQFLGIYCDSSASDLVARFPEKKKEIEVIADGKMGTKLRYVEWWSAGEQPSVFWTIEKLVLGKMRNPHFNYPTQEMQTDEFGNETPQTVGGRNYFKRPEIPVTLLVTNTLGKRPFDATNGLFQCLAMQDVVSKRWKQIDRNADNSNNSIVASLEYFEEGQAAQAAQALRNGDVMLQPKGKAGEGITRIQGDALPAYVYENLQDARSRILSVYGVGGSIPSALQQDKSVRGKMIIRGADDDRIGGGFGEHLELFAARIYEQLLQLMYVYYDEPKVASVIGKEKAAEWFQLSSNDLQSVSLTVCVREGSMIPKDSMSRRQEALDLWGANGIDPISLFEALDFPSPRDSARALYLWQTQPQALFPEVINQMTPPNTGQPQPGQAQGSAPPEPQTPSTQISLSPLPQ
jgi:hypothetical protein